LGLSNCGESFNENKAPIELKTSQAFSIEVVEEEDIGEYSVLIFHKNKEKFSVIRRDFVNDEIKELVVDTSQEFLDDDVTSGFVYRYDLGFYNQNKEFELLHSEEVRIPVDINIETGQSEKLENFFPNLSPGERSAAEINRLRLQSGATLFTMGANVSLRVSKLESQSGSISTFPENQKATLGVEGRSGGNLRLEIQHAIGELNVVMRGEDGGDGEVPPPIGAVGKGKNSTNAGSPGVAERRITQLVMSQPSIASEQCLKNPGQGGTGGRGAKGLEGNSGLDGGATGRALIFVNQDSPNFEIVYSLEPGVGGKGSVGGQGGPGGDGGPTGGEDLKEYVRDENLQSVQVYDYFNKIPKICDRKPGKNGPRGDQGEPGDDGATGEIGIICINQSLDSETKCFKESEKQGV
jgi:hypothetical protein